MNALLKAEPQSERCQLLEPVLIFPYYNTHVSLLSRVADGMVVLDY